MKQITLLLLTFSVFFFVGSTDLTAKKPSLTELCSSSLNKEEYIKGMVQYPKRLSDFYLDMTQEISANKPIGWLIYHKLMVRRIQKKLTTSKLDGINSLLLNLQLLHHQKSIHQNPCNKGDY